ncbi:hypothetical protein ACFYXF_16365 [Streptomyces sp. NPDC002680]|uniref:hypothetical protein n=1 Tax=Streptomyces sp. NPDC002680 TaxID=3364659 RepID=UPI0036B4E872
MQAPLPRRSKGPSAIAAASAAVANSDSGSEDDSEPRPEPEAPTPPLSAAAAAFVVEELAEPATPAQTSAQPAKTVKATVAPPPAGRRLPQVALLAGAIVVGAALIGGAILAVGADDDDGQASASPPSAVPGTTQGGGPSASEPSRPGSASPSVSLSASPSANRTSASPKSPTAEPTKDSGAGAPVQDKPSATVAADDSGSTANGSVSVDADTSCTATAGSGAMTGYFACASAGNVRLQVTFHTSERFLHAFFDTDGNTATGYRLPYPSPSALGADYMIENGVLYRSRSTSWKWSEITARPTETVSGSTYTWTLPLSRLGSPTGTQRVQFNAGTDFTPVLTFSPK